MVSDHTGLHADYAIFAEAMKEQGIEVSISPGTSMNVENATFVASNGLARHYRITDDMVSAPSRPPGATPPQRRERRQTTC